MIIEVNGKKLAFGMAWKTLVGGGVPEAMAVARARADKSPLIWTDAETFQVGLLPAADMTEKEVSSLNAPVFAAALALGKIPDLKKNVLMVLNNPKTPGTFILIGLRKGKPHGKFDLAGITGEVLQQKITEFRDLLKGDEFNLLGDVRGLEGIYHTPINVLGEFADAACALHRPKSQVPYRKFGVVAGIVLSCFLIAKVGAPMAMKKWREHHQTKQPDPQKNYDAALANTRMEPALPATELGSWYGWFRKLPWDIGGWNLSTASCSFTPSGAMFCALDYKRAITQATNKTFLDALPQMWEHSYRLGDDVAHIQTQAPVGHIVRVGQFLEHAPTQNDVSINFKSQLQSYQVAGTFKLSAPTLFGATGIDPSQLRNTYFAMPWLMDGPVRNFELLAKFPSYAIVSSINITVNSQPQGAIDNSMFKATVKGQVLVKG
jgi:hypothetical protein